MMRILFPTVALLAAGCVETTADHEPVVASVDGGAEDAAAQDAAPLTAAPLTAAPARQPEQLDPVTARLQEVTAEKQRAIAAAGTVVQPPFDRQVRTYDPALAARVTPCGSGHCTDTSLDELTACELAARARFAAEDYLGAAKTASCFERQELTEGPVDVTLFGVDSFDWEARYSAVVSSAGRRWVVPVFEIYSYASGDETLNDVYLDASVHEGRVRLVFDLTTTEIGGACTDDLWGFEARRRQRIFCAEASDGALRCTGRVPMSVISWETRSDEGGFEVARRRLEHLGLRADWSGTDLVVRRRFGRIGSYGRYLGRHAPDRLDTVNGHTADYDIQLFHEPEY